jgi:cytochrome P450
LKYQYLPRNFQFTAQHPEHQQKCIDEIDEIFGTDDRSPTMNDLHEMNYLEMCIKEALR